MVMALIMAMTATSLLAQDPPQYGTPYSGVPDPRDVNMYQVHIRPYSAAGNLAGVTSRLDAIKALGTNVIYLMPIYPTGTDSRSSISPYCIKDFKSVGSEYGSLSDLRSLVDGAHARGMAVILDWVVNQTSWDHPWITQHPDWYVRDGAGVIQPLNPFPDVAALNFNSAAMRTEMINAMRYWIFAANVDGFRCDYANNPPLSFWTECIGNLRGITSHKLLMFAEGDRLENFQVGFDLNFGDKWYYDAIRSIANGTSVAQIQTTTNTEYTYANATQQVVRYTTNHDVQGNETPIQIFKSHDGVIANFLVSAYMRGVPMMGSGQETDFNQTIPWPWTTVKINWNTNPSAANDFTKVLNFRTSSVAIRRGTMTNYSDANVCAFTKINGSEKVVVMVNLRNSTQNYTIPAAFAGSYVDAYTNTAATLTAGTVQSLAPFQYRVLTNANVTPVAVTGVTVSPTSANVNVGLTQQLSATISPANATNQNVTWSSSNNAIATVSSTGLVTGVAAGTVNITVTTQDGNKTAAAAITVTPASTFTVHFYKPATWGTGIRIYWWSALPAGVLADGSWPGITMTNEGNNWYGYTFTNVTSTNLIFNDGTNQTANLSRDSNGWYMDGVWYNSQPSAVAVTGVTVSPTSATLNVSATQQLTATVIPSNATNKTVTWSSTNSGVATVSSSGLVTAVGAGTATITATTQDGNKIATSSITVTAVQAPYGGVARAIPGTIQIEDFDTGGEGTAYHDNDAGNSGNQYRTTERVDIEACSEGGHNVGWTNTGEWLEYTVNVAAAGTYDIAVRVASGGSGGIFKILFNNVDKTGTLTVGGTGGWQSWQTITKTNVTLSAGTQVMQFYFNTGGFNVNSVSITASASGSLYYAIQNRWTNAYLYDAGANVGYGASIASNNYKWEKVAVDGTYFYLRNLGTGEYMHIENQTGAVQASAITQGWWSAHWSEDYIDGTWIRVRNRWQTGSILHVENQTGSAQYAGAQDGWYSAQWKLVPVSASGKVAGNTEVNPQVFEEAVQIYPNPARGKQFNIVVPGLGANELANIVIRDMNGRMVLETTVDQSGKLEHSLHSGLYIVRVKTSTLNAYKKIIIEE